MKEMIRAQEPYRSIACSDYDLLIRFVMQKRETKVRFLQDGKHQELIGKLEDVYTLKGEEFLKVDGISIRLDLIQDVDGQQISKDASCRV
jgi:transcriptional antiterminator Rof (Rho-off)